MAIQLYPKADVLGYFVYVIPNVISICITSITIRPKEHKNKNIKACDVRYEGCAVG